MPPIFSVLFTMLACPPKTDPGFELAYVRAWAKHRGRDEAESFYSGGDNQDDSGGGDSSVPRKSVGQVSRDLGIMEQTYYAGEESMER
jgi:hypothetical protein